jgi:hypothetical protein
MANNNFVVHNGLQVGLLTVNAADGSLTTAGPITSTSSTPTKITGANLVVAPGTNSTSLSNGALVVVGGAGISGNLNVGGDVVINGNISVLGNSVSIGSTSLSIQDPIINLHSPSDLSALASDDGFDIGIKMHYFKGADKHAFLGLANDTGYLEWYATGNDASNVFIGTAYGTIKSGELIIANATTATSSTTGAIRATGGISTQGNIYVGSGAYWANNRSIGTQVTTRANTAPSAATSKLGDRWYDTYTDTMYEYIGDGTGTYWVDMSSVPYNYQANVSVAGAALSITGNGSVGNLVVSGTLQATASSANYADLAEMYESDTDYPSGTVVVFGGDKEITQSTESHDTRVAGVISERPAYLMNAGWPIGTYHPVALTGRVPCRVQGPVAKGQVVVSGTEPGTAQAIDETRFRPGVVIGKSLGTIEDTSVQTIEVAVGRF